MKKLFIMAMAAIFAANISAQEVKAERPSVKKKTRSAGKKTKSARSPSRSVPKRTSKRSPTNSTSTAYRRRSSPRPTATTGRLSWNSEKTSRQSSRRFSMSVRRRRCFVSGADTPAKPKDTTKAKVRASTRSRSNVLF